MLKIPCSLLFVLELTVAACSEKAPERSRPNAGHDPSYNQGKEGGAQQRRRDPRRHDHLDDTKGPRVVSL